MEISSILTSVQSRGDIASTARANLGPAEESGKSEETHRHQGHRRGGGRGHALGVFRQEMRMALKAHFHAKFASAQQNYAAVQEPTSSDDVAREAVGAAKQLVAESPVRSAESLISFRAKVEETATYVRDTVGANDDVEDVDDAVARIGEGLDELEADVAQSRESSATVLSVDTRTKQRSTIQIRTQEGDVVKLSLRRRESLSAMDVAVSNGNGTASSTEVEVSSRSRMMLKVEGDINESELAAIQNVFAQAEQIANDFFGGDIAQAFSLAEGFEFDAEQLARVNMRFGMRQVSNISYTEAVRPAEIGPVSTPTVAAPEPAAAPQPVSAPQPVASPIGSAQPASSTSPAAVAPAGEPVSTPVAEPTGVPAVNSPAVPSALEISPALTDFLGSLTDFLDSLATFLRSVSEGFAAADSSGGFGAADNNASFTYHYSESFKLTLLNAVIHAVAPEGAADAAATAESVIYEVVE